MARTDSTGCCYGPCTPEGDCTQAPAFTWRPTCAAVLCGPGLDAPALQRWLADSARGGAVVSVLDAAACLATLDPSSALGLEVAAARAVRAESCEPANTSQAALGSKCGPRAGVYCCPLCLPCLLCVHTSLLSINVRHLD